VRVLALLALAACGDPYNGTLTPETAAGAPEGHLVVVIGTVFATSWDSTQTAMRKQQLSEHAGDLDWILEQGDEEIRGRVPAYDDAGAKYPRTPDHYVLVRSKTPPKVTNGDPDFTPGALVAAWGLGVHLMDIDPATPLPEIGDRIEITGKIAHVTWNTREVKVPIVEDPTITILDGAAPLAGPGDPCTLDQDCNARLVCDRTALTCMPPPREIYWADPWRDVNGACDTDADCPLGQVCDASHVIAATGAYAAHYFPAQDTGRHMCTLVPGATVASQCPRIYTARDIAGARFATGKEICVRATLLAPTAAADGDTHDQVFVDEPIPYPTDDIHYELFGATTENGPIYKDPTTPGGAVVDPVAGQEFVAVGTYRYDPDHGWYEVHPVKAYLPPPP
jgi:hypothetical protein